MTLFTFLSACCAYAQGWQWGKGNTGDGMDGWPVATDQSGNVFGGGFTFTSGPIAFDGHTVPGPVGITNSVIVKYGPSGNFQWVQATQGGNAYIINIATDLQGNSFMFGIMVGTSLQIGSYTLSNSSANMQYFLIKFDPSGNVLWAVNEGSTSTNYRSVSGLAVVLSLGGIATDAAGNIYITSNFQKASTTVGSFVLTNADPTGKTEDILVVKYDPSGNVVWAKSYGGNGNDDAYGITVTPAGDVYLAGVYNSSSLRFGTSVLNGTAITPTPSSIYQSAFIARLDNSGNAKWAAASGGTGLEYAIGIASDANNNVYLTGGLMDSSITFSGTIINNPTPQKRVLYLIKFDATNNVSWYKTIHSMSSPGTGSSGNDYGAWGYSISMSQCGVIWVSGAFSDSINIDGHVLTCPTLPRGHVKADADPIFIAGYSASGVYAGSAALASGGDDQNGIACDAAGNVYMCSDYTSDYGMIAGKDTLPVSISANELMYVAKFKSLNEQAEISTDYHEVCGPDVILHAQEGYQNYNWSNGASSASQQVSGTGIFWVSASNSCTSFYVDTFSVQNCGCQHLYFVPNSFSPNGDGHNDVFYPRYGGASGDISTIKSFRIYDRWGELLFNRENIAPNDRSKAWDGTFNGQKPLPEVYVWVLQATCSDGSEFTKKGNVTIIK